MHAGEDGEKVSDKALRRRLEELGLDPNQPPGKEEWQTFLGWVTRELQAREYSPPPAGNHPETARYINEALRQSEANYRSIFEGVQDAIFVQSMDGRVLDVNRRACEMYGWTREELLSKRVKDLVPEGQPYVLPAEMVAQGLTDQIIETTNIRSNGETFPVEISANLHFRDGEPVMLVVVRDVTETRQAQQRVQLQDRLAAVGQLAAGIAHDFNNILGTIILYSELLLESSTLMPKDRERLATIVKQAQRGSTLISQILDFGRRSVMERHPMDLVPFFREIEALLSRTLPEHMKISIQFNGQDAYFVDADPTRMQQVIMNLAVNARDAMPKGGELRFMLDEVTVRAPHIPFPGMEPGRWVRIRVTDTGTGIPASDLPHVFEPFFTTKPQGKGTGLGLAQVYGIVKQHDGYIDVDSRPGQGTTFTILLPAIEEPSEALGVSDIEEARAGSGERILVVEDDEATRLAICEILESLGYVVSGAADGKDAVHLLIETQGGFDLIVSDLVMPNMGGRELHDIVTEQYPRVRMVLMTGYPLGTHTRELLDYERVTWIQKPITSDTLSQAVRAMLRPKQMPAPAKG